MNPPELDYAPLPPIHRRPIVRRVVVIAAILVLLPAFFWISQTAYLRSRYLRYQQQCEDFTLPAGSVAYEENPTAAAALWQKEGNSGNYSHLVDQQGKIIMVVMRPKAQWETSLRPESKLYQHAAVFLHWRCVKGGERRLVCVYPNDFITHRKSMPQVYNGDSPDLSVQVIRPATLLRDSERPFAKEFDVARLLGHPFGTVRIFAGQPDANDESHFTINIQTPDGNDTIDGWLMSDDSVKLTLRPPAATQSTTP